ncbi:hypothetical protein EGW08_000497, partial [Elysia chlorotica]
SQKGYYLLANSHLNGPPTRLTSPPFESSGQGLLFYYHAYQESYLIEQFMTGQFSVTATDISTGVETELWRTDMHDIDGWREQCLTLPEGQLTVTFEAVRGVSLSANIGLDDVELLDVSCDIFLSGNRFISRPYTLMAADAVPTTEETTKCGSDQYTCGNGMCINLKQVCDTVEDCPDGMDEISCN